MSTEDWVLKDTKLITNTKKQKLKIQSGVWNFKNTMLKNRRREIRGKKSQKIILKKYRYKIDNKYQNQKLKIQSRVWNFRNTMLKKRRRKRKRKTNKQKQTKSQKL